MEHLLVIMLVVLPGVWSGEWGVTTQRQCILRGTSAVIPCSYDYPSWHSVRKVQWLKREESRLQGLTSSRFQFVGDKSHNCNLKILNIRHADEGFYYFRFETYWDRWISESPAYIFVRDLIASVEPPTVTEGEVVTLRCRSGCNAHINIQPLWFKDERRVSNTQFSASKEAAGTYTCALPGQEHIQSNVVSLKVLYAPKKVMLSVNPSDDIMLGSTVIFSCSSDANPRVAHSGYILFKDGHFISYGPEYKISEVQLGDSGQYYCQAGNNITWRGSRLFQSPKTNVNVQYPPTNVSILLDSFEVTEGSVVNLTCRSNASPPVFGYTWYRAESAPSSMVQVGSGPVLSLSPVEASHSGQYMCHAWNKHGENNSTKLLLSVKAKNTGSSIPILAGIGVALLIVFVLVLLLFWKKQRIRPDKQTKELSERHTSSADVEMVDHIYANTQMLQTRPTEENADYSSIEEVFYTTVTIKPKKPIRKSQMRRTAPEKEESVIYATVAKSS